jgi:carboxyl-terminal processing protease
MTARFFRRRRVAVRIIACAVLLGILWPGAGDRALSASTTVCKTINSAADVAPQGTPTLATVKEGFNCLVAHYITGKKLDDEKVLGGAYRQMVTSLQADGVGIPSSIVEPVFSGPRDHDWLLFAQAFQRLSMLIPPGLFIPGALGELALYGMTGSLNDSHTAYLPADQLHPAVAELFDSGPVPTLGLVVSPISPTVQLFVTQVFTGTPAAEAGILPGDIITLVNGHAPYSSIGGEYGLAPLIIPQLKTSVNIVVNRPSSGATISFKLTPLAMTPPDITVRVIAHSFYYVKLYNFTKNSTNEILADIAALQMPHGVKGIVLDLRGNGGGLIDGAVRLLSAFVHDKTLFVSVDGAGRKDPQQTDDKVPLLHLPLVVLIDSGSASSSEIVATAVRDYHLGALVGTRTAGALGGAEFFGLNDGSGLEITEARVLGAKGEVIDGVGIGPGTQVSTSAHDLSTGHDPAVDEAIRKLRTLTRAS